MYIGYTHISSVAAALSRTLHGVNNVLNILTFTLFQWLDYVDVQIMRMKVHLCRLRRRRWVVAGAPMSLGSDRSPPPPATCLPSTLTAGVRGSSGPGLVSASPSWSTTSAGRQPPICLILPTEASRLTGGLT